MHGFIVWQSPHGLLLILAFVFAILAAIPVPAKIAWLPWSWVFFLASCLFG